MAQKIGQLNILPINNIDGTQQHITPSYVRWSGLPESFIGQEATFNIVAYDSQGITVYNDSYTGTIQQYIEGVEVVKRIQFLDTIFTNGETYTFYSVATVTIDNVEYVQISPNIIIQTGEEFRYALRGKDSSSVPKWENGSVLVRFTGGTQQKKIYGYRFKLYNAEQTILYKDTDVIYLNTPTNTLRQQDATYVFSNLLYPQIDNALSDIYAIVGTLYFDDNTTYSMNVYVKKEQEPQYSTLIVDDGCNGYTEIQGVNVNTVNLSTNYSLSLYKYIIDEYNQVLIDNINIDNIQYVQALGMDGNDYIYKINIDNLPEEDITVISGDETSELIYGGDIWTDGNITITYYPTFDAIPLNYKQLGVQVGDYIALTVNPFIIQLENNNINVPNNVSFSVKDYTAQHGVQATYLLSLNNTQIIAISNEQVIPNYNYVYITDKNNIYALKAEVEYGDTQSNRQIGVHTPLNVKYPTIVSNGVSNYQSGEVTAFFTKEEFYQTGTIGIQTGQEFLNFLTQDTIKILKDWNGNIWMIHITDNPKIEYINDMGMSLVKISFNWTEIADVDDEQSIKYTNWYNQ